jgi:hypothetical protein
MKQETTDLDRLHEHFGGREAFGVAAQKLAAWGRKNLPSEIYEFCGSSFDGVLAMHRAMEASDGR